MNNIFYILTFMIFTNQIKSLPAKKHFQRLTVEDVSPKINSSIKFPISSVNISDESNMFEKNLKNIDQKIPLEANKANIQQENLLIELNENSKNRNRIKGGNGQENEKRCWR